MSHLLHSIQQPAFLIIIALLFKKNLHVMLDVLFALSLSVQWHKNAIIYIIFKGNVHHEVWHRDLQPCHP